MISTRLEKIIRDADCSHIGSKTYLEVSELLKKEWELTCDRHLTEAEWLDEKIAFLSTKHRFHTPEAASIWDKRKGKVTYSGREYYVDSNSAFCGLKVDLRRIKKTQVQSRVAKGRRID